MLRKILTGAASIALIAGANAQQKQQVTIEKAVTPQHAGTFSPLTGFVGTSNTARIGTAHVINNSILTQYYSIPGMNQEWTDNNVLTDTDGTGAEVVDGMVYTYCSSDLNPNGMTEVVTIYDDSVYCAGPTNWPIADCGYGVYGLPGAVNGALACWIVTVDLAGVECNLTDGHGGSAGWGQVWDNGVSGHWLASGGNGQTNSFTWFDWNAHNANAFLGCFWFGGVPHAGFDMQMFAGGASGLTLSTTGAPGGAMTFDTAGATPGGIVALMYAFGGGAHAVMNPLTGNIITTGLADAGFSIASFGSADGAGNYSYGSNVPSAATGLVCVQSVDGMTDILSNVIHLGGAGGPSVVDVMDSVAVYYSDFLGVTAPLMDQADQAASQSLNQADKDAAIQNAQDALNKALEVITEYNGLLPSDQNDLEQDPALIAKNREALAQLSVVAAATANLNVALAAFIATPNAATKAAVDAAAAALDDASDLLGTILEAIGNLVTAVLGVLEDAAVAIGELADKVIETIVKVIDWLFGLIP